MLVFIFVLLPHVRESNRQLPLNWPCNLLHLSNCLNRFHHRHHNFRSNLFWRCGKLPNTRNMLLLRLQFYQMGANCGCKSQNFIFSPSPIGLPTKCVNTLLVGGMVTSMSPQNNLYMCNVRHNSIRNLCAPRCASFGCTTGHWTRMWRGAQPL